MGHTGSGNHKTVTRMATTTTQRSTLHCARPTPSSDGLSPLDQPPSPILPQVATLMKVGGSWTGPPDLELEKNVFFLTTLDKTFVKNTLIFKEKNSIKALRCK